MVAPILKRPFSSSPTTADTSFSTYQHLQKKASPDRTQSHTSTHFDGIVALMDPKTSWVDGGSRCVSHPLAISSVLWTNILTAEQPGVYTGCAPYAAIAGFPKMQGPSWRAGHQ